MTFGAMPTPLASGDAAIALIPQKPPFVLVDTLIDATPTTFRSGFTVPASHVLVEGNSLLDAGLMENAAQTAALGMGHEAARLGSAPPLGFIGAIAKLSITGQAHVGDRLDTEVVVKHEVMNARVLEATITCGDRTLAHMELKVFIIDTEAAA